jgi:hypothetical protein
MKLEKNKKIEEKTNPIIERVDKCIKFDEIINDIEKTILENEIFLNPQEKNIVKKEIEKIKDFLKKNQFPSKKEIENKKEEIREKIQPIIDISNLRKDLLKYGEEIEKIGKTGRLVGEEDNGEEIFSNNEKNELQQLGKNLINFSKNKLGKDELLKKKEEIINKVEPIIGDAKERKDLKDYLTNLNDLLIKNDIQTVGKLKDDEKKIISNEIKEGLEWIKKNNNSKKNEVEKKKIEILKKIDPILKLNEKKLEEIENIEDNISNLKEFIDNNKISNIITPQEKKKVNDIINETNEYLKKNPTSDLKDLEKKKKELDEKTLPIIEDVKSREDLLFSLNNLKEKIKDDKFLKKLNEQEKKIIKDTINNIEKWMKENPNSNKKENKLKQELIEKDTKSIIEKAEKLIELDELKKELKDFVKNNEKQERNLNEKDKKLIDETSSDIKDFINSNPKNIQDIIEKRKALKKRII